MALRHFIRRFWHKIAWLTIDDLDDRVDYLECIINDLGNKLMATLDTLSADTAAAFTAVTTFISDVSVEVAALAQQIADLKAQLGSLTPEQQALIDSADTNAQNISAAIADASANLNPPTE